jgi:hypothetical protein
MLISHKLILCYSFSGCLHHERYTHISHNSTNILIINIKLVGGWGIFSTAHNILPVSLPLPIYLRPCTKWILISYNLILCYSFSGCLHHEGYTPIATAEQKSELKSDGSWGIFSIVHNILPVSLNGY